MHQQSLTRCWCPEGRVWWSRLPHAACIPLLHPWRRVAHAIAADAIAAIAASVIAAVAAGTTAAIAAGASSCTCTTAAICSLWLCWAPKAIPATSAKLLLLVCRAEATGGPCCTNTCTVASAEAIRTCPWSAAACCAVVTTRLLLLLLPAACAVRLLPWLLLPLLPAMLLHGVVRTCWCLCAPVLSLNPVQVQVSQQVIFIKGPCIVALVATCREPCRATSSSGSGSCGSCSCGVVVAASCTSLLLLLLPTCRCSLYQNKAAQGKSMHARARQQSGGITTYVRGSVKVSGMPQTLCAEGMDGMLPPVRLW